MKNQSTKSKNVTTKTMQKLMGFAIICSLFSLNNSFCACRNVDLKKAFRSFSSDPAVTSVSGRQTVRIVFWNVENLYDPYDDSTRLDNEFIPGGTMRWTYSRFRIKLNHTAKTLVAAGEWVPPAIIGLCEVENRYVMNKLIFDSPLKYFGYRMIHHESPDLRGIDVALLYRPQVIRILHSRPVRIVFPFDTSARTREILHVRVQVISQCRDSSGSSRPDTLDLLVNHWPSRRGGYAESQPRRDYVAGILRHLIDSLLLRDPERKILVMGDFNDEPASASIRTILRSLHPDSASQPSDLRNLMAPFSGKTGSHRFRGVWSLLDQFMVSESLFKPGHGLHVIPGSASIFRAGFLLEEDVKYFGPKPVRTFNGLRYQGGFSDHLPIVVDLEE
jgi:predicted extracellular nuclease